MKTKKIIINPAMVLSALAVFSCAGLFISSKVHADEAGVSFWLPGQYGSLAAIPAEPGWSLALIYYHASVDGGGNQEFQKGDNLTLGLDVSEDLLIPMLTYVFESTVWGGGKLQLGLLLTGGMSVLMWMQR